MKLWLLRPNPENNSDWEPWYDKCFGFVVRAKTETDARICAVESEEFGDEGRECWLDATKTICIEILPDGPSQVIILDFASA